MGFGAGDDPVPRPLAFGYSSGYSAQVTHDRIRKQFEGLENYYPDWDPMYGVDLNPFGIEYSTRKANENKLVQALYYFAHKVGEFPTGGFYYREDGDTIAFSVSARALGFAVKEMVDHHVALELDKERKKLEVQSGYEIARLNEEIKRLERANGHKVAENVALGWKLKTEVEGLKESHTKEIQRLKEQEICFHEYDIMIDRDAWEKMKLSHEWRRIGLWASWILTILLFGLWGIR